MTRNRLFDVSPPSADIYVGGLGLRVPEDLTVETVAILHQVQRAYSLPTVNLSAISPELDVQDLSHHYSARQPRSESYRLMAEEVLAAALAEPPVAFLTYGHPQVGTDVTANLRHRATEIGLQIYISDAPSSIEAVCRLVGLDPFDGAQVWEATRFLAAKPACTASWLLLMQVPYIGTSAASHTSPSARYAHKALMALREHLVECYGPEHNVMYVRAAVLDYPESVDSFPLNKLVEYTPLSAATLVVPPLNS